MDSFDLSDLRTVGQQSMLFGSYPQPSSTIKRQQTYPPSFAGPVYNSIEDWSAAELTTDSAPSPGSGSPVSPVFSTFSFSNNVSGEDWAAWDKIEQSPESDFFLKSEILDSPDLSSIPIMSPVVDAAADAAATRGLDEVVFGREGVSDTRPIFESPQFNLNMPPQARQQQQQQQQPFSSAAANTRTSPPSMAGGLPTPPEPTTTTTTTSSSSSSSKSQHQQERRYPARNNLKRKSSDDAASSSSPSSPRSSCSPPPPQRRHTTATTSPRDDGPHAKHPTTTTTTTTLGPKKTAHNMIEKRYRTNLNDKIAALRDSVPALRVMVHRLEHADGEGSGAAAQHQGQGQGHGQQQVDVMDEIKAEAGLDPGDDDLGGVAPAHKLNKATILSKATEYIAHLERRNRALAKENSALRNRVEGFEMLVMSRSGQRSLWN